MSSDSITASCISDIASQPELPRHSRTTGCSSDSPVLPSRTRARWLRAVAGGVYQTLAARAWGTSPVALRTKHLDGRRCRWPVKRKPRRCAH